MGDTCMQLNKIPYLTKLAVNNRKQGGAPYWGRHSKRGKCRCLVVETSHITRWGGLLPVHVGGVAHAPKSNKYLKEKCVNWAAVHNKQHN